jgi:MarR family transcriptional regulator for hemolysin
MRKPTDSRLAEMTTHLLAIHRAYRAAADKALADYGLSQATAWPVIWTGRLGDGVRQGVLADAMGVEGPSLVRLLDQLVAAGLIERREDALDRRAKTLHLTPAGHALRERVEEMLLHLRRHVFQGVDAADIDACLRVFESIRTNLARPLPFAPLPAKQERGQ